jgi:hypothetical protein
LESRAESFELTDGLNSFSGEPEGFAWATVGLLSSVATGTLSPVMIELIAALSAGALNEALSNLDAIDSFQTLAEAVGSEAISDALAELGPDGFEFSLDDAHELAIDLVMGDSLNAWQTGDIDDLQFIFNNFNTTEGFDPSEWTNALANVGYFEAVKEDNFSASNAVRHFENALLYSDLMDMF